MTDTLSAKAKLIITVACGLAVIGYNQFLADEAYRDDPVSYKAPGLSELRSAHGLISVHRRHNERYGTLVLTPEVGDTLTFTCSPPGEWPSTYDCYDSWPYTHLGIAKSDVVRKRGRVWWAAYPDPNSNTTGRVYQIEVDGNMILPYARMVDFYERTKRPPNAS